MELANTLVDGKNVRQRVEADYHENKRGGGQRMGASYWRNLASEYGVAGDWSSLEVKDKDTISRQGLIDALEIAVNPNCAQRDTEAFGAYMSHIADLSEKELVGIAMTLSSSSGIGRKPLDKLWSDVAAYLTRCKFRNTTADFRRLFKREIDAVLQRTWTGLKKNNVRLQTFITSYDHILAWLFEGTDYGPVRACNGQWSTCIPHLQRLTKASDLGELLFSFVWELLNADALCDCIATRLKSFDFATVTQQSWSKLQSELMEDMSAFANSKVLFSKRMISLEYRGAKLSLQCHSPTSEMHLRLMAMVKEKLTGSKGGLVPLLHERWIEFDGTLETVEWAPGILDSLHKARALATDILQPAYVACVSDLDKLLGGSRELLTNVDSSFLLELTYASTAVEDLLPAAIHKDVFSALPARNAALSMATSLERLQQLQASQKVLVSSRSCQDEVAAAVEAVGSVFKSEQPKIQAGQTAYMSRLLAHLQFFIRHSNASVGGAVGSAEQPQQELVGKAALKAKLVELKALISADAKALTLARLDIFQTYRYLLEENDKKDVDSYVAQVLDKVSGGQMAALAGGASSKTKQKPAKAESSIARFF